MTNGERAIFEMLSESFLILLEAENMIVLTAKYEKKITSNTLKINLPFKEQVILILATEKWA